MIRRLDRWLGRAIFQPPIIWICQRTRITQMAFHRYAWWAAALHAVWYDKGVGWGQIAFDGVFVLVRTLSAGIAPDRPTNDAPWLRMLLLGLLVITGIGDMINRAVDAVTVNVLMALAAEYATTIRTIPPREVKERRAARNKNYAGDAM